MRINLLAEIATTTTVRTPSVRVNLMVQTVTAPRTVRVVNNLMEKI